MNDLAYLPSNCTCSLSTKILHEISGVLKLLKQHSQMLWWPKDPWVSSGVRSMDEQTMGYGSIMSAKVERKIRLELQMGTREDRASGLAWGDPGECNMEGEDQGSKLGQAETLQI